MANMCICMSLVAICIRFMHEKAVYSPDTTGFIDGFIPFLKYRHLPEESGLFTR